VTVPLNDCRLKKFDSGVLVVQFISHSEDAVVRETKVLVSLLSFPSLGKVDRKMNGQ
jgi:hypothetical protein